MPETKTFWETIKIEGGNVIDAVRDLIHKGNVRRVVIEHQGRTVAEFPLTVGVVGSVLRLRLRRLAPSTRWRRTAPSKSNG